MKAIKKAFKDFALWRIMKIIEWLMAGFIDLEEYVPDETTEALAKMHSSLVAYFSIKEIK